MSHLHPAASKSCAFQCNQLRYFGLSFQAVCFFRRLQRMVKTMEKTHLVSRIEQ